MKRSTRALGALLLACALTALAFPLALHVGPPVLETLNRPGPPAPPPVPAVQRPPASLSEPAVVSELSDTAPAPAPGVLGPLLDAELGLQHGAFTGVVRDARTGKVLYDRAGAEPVPPASNIKLFTAAAALTHLRPEARLKTSVSVHPDGGVLYLRGGGDVLLGAGESKPNAVVGRAGLATLAAETAAALDPESGPYALFLDDTFFQGEALNPTWAAGDVEAGEVAPIYPLAVNSAWLDEGTDSGPRHSDAALAAAGSFSRALVAAAAERGVEVRAGVDRGAAPATAEVLASVESATIAAQVEHMLVASDNYLAEALARVAAEAAGSPASFGGATDTMSAAAAALGVPADGMQLGDAAGLSVRNAVSAGQLTDLLRALAVSDDPALAGLLGALPIASLSGTLEERFTGGAETGAGIVRAKTGTLSAVSALSGQVVTGDGRLLVFSLIASGLDGHLDEARTAADNAASVLAACGCR